MLFKSCLVLSAVMLKLRLILWRISNLKGLVIPTSKIHGWIRLHGLLVMFSI
ncbi:hypothetical protein HID58_067117 [Brassica napus]|uniref:Uncharacterized protein n=1 Tax=Brassica napus TaxID=3708 RepID=A0ABQ7ZHP2_BRANA|nr:hypothetical protein HID58_067117 [Brassica napus]